MNIFLIVLFVGCGIFLLYVSHYELTYNGKKLRKQIEHYNNFVEMLDEFSGNIIIETEINTLRNKLKTVI